MDLETLVRSYAKQFILSADLTSLVTALAGALVSLWLGKRVTTFVLKKGFSLSWGAAKWLFASRPLGDVAAEILRAMEYTPCRVVGDFLHIGNALRFSLDRFTHTDGEKWLQHTFVVGDKPLDWPADMPRREYKHAQKHALAILAALQKHADQLDQGRLIAHLRGETPQECTVYYQGGQVFITAVKPKDQAEAKTPTPTVTPGVDGEPATTRTTTYDPPYTGTVSSSALWNRVLSDQEIKDEYEKAKDASSGPLALPAGVHFVGNSGCNCDGDEECTVCQEWARKAMAAADRRAPKTRCPNCGGDGIVSGCPHCTPKKSV